MSRSTAFRVLSIIGTIMSWSLVYMLGLLSCNKPVKHYLEYYHIDYFKWPVFIKKCNLSHLCFMDYIVRIRLVPFYYLLPHLHGNKVTYQNTCLLNKPIPLYA